MIEDFFFHRPGTGIGKAIEAGFPNRLSNRPGPHHFKPSGFLKLGGQAWGLTQSLGNLLALGEDGLFPTGSPPFRLV